MQRCETLQPSRLKALLEIGIRGYEERGRQLTADVAAVSATPKS
jgi:hypothetical protein